MGEIDLSDEMVRRAVVAYHGLNPKSKAPSHDGMRKALTAAFEGVPLTNYGIGLALQAADLVIVVRDAGMDSRAIVCRRNGDEHGFETAGHNIDLGWAQKPRPYLNRVSISKIASPDAPLSGESGSSQQSPEA